MPKAPRGGAFNMATNGGAKWRSPCSTRAIVAASFS